MEQSGLSKLEVYHVNTRGLIHCCFQSRTPESNQMDLGSSPSPAAYQLCDHRQIASPL